MGGDQRHDRGRPSYPARLVDDVGCLRRPGARRAPAVAEVVDAAGGRYTVRYLTRLYLARPLH